MGFRRKHPFLLGDVLLQDVVLERAAQVLPVHALLFGGHQEKSEEDHRRAVDGHGNGHISEWNRLKETCHVVRRVDGYPAVTDLSEGDRIIRVVAHQSRHVESNRQSMLAFRQQFPKPFIGVGHAGKPGELTYRPELAAIPGGMNAARVRVGTGESDTFVDVPTVNQGRDLFEGKAHESFTARLLPSVVALPVFPPAQGFLPTTTSEPQLGHGATSMSPTMKLKEHSWQVVFGDGFTGSGATGGTVNDGSGAAAGRTSLTAPQAGHGYRPTPPDTGIGRPLARETRYCIARTERSSWRFLHRFSHGPDGR